MGLRSARGDAARRKSLDAAQGGVTTAARAGQDDPGEGGFLVTKSRQDTQDNTPKTQGKQATTVFGQKKQELKRKSKAKPRSTPKVSRL